MNTLLVNFYYYFEFSFRFLKNLFTGKDVLQINRLMRQSMDLKDIIYSECSILFTDNMPYYFDLFRISTPEINKLILKIYTNDIYHLKGIKTPNPVIFDIGSHLGEFSRIAKFIYPDATIHAFEPDPENFYFLKKNKLSFTNFNTYQLGIFDENKKIRFSKSKNISWRSSIIEDTNFIKKFEKNEFDKEILVDVTTVDNFVINNKISQVDLIKITVAGEIEDKVLNASINTIIKYRPIVGILNYCKHDSYVRNFFNKLDYKEIPISNKKYIKAGCKIFIPL